MFSKLKFKRKPIEKRYNFQQQDTATPFLYWVILILGIAAICYMTVWDSNAQTITKKYDAVNRIRIDNSNPSELKPCFLFFPGGGFFSQNWAICNIWSAIAVSQGYVSCKVGYSTSFPSLPAANKGIQDCMNAVKWVKLHWAQYGIDTNRIYLAGTSAGGFCAMGAYQYNVKVAGILNGWGGVLNMTYLSQMNIQVYNVSTDIDNTVPVGCGNAFGVPCCGSQAIYNELVLLGVKTDWLVFEGYSHGLLPKDSEYNNRVNMSFLNAIQFFK